MRLPRILLTVILLFFGATVSGAAERTTNSPKDQLLPDDLYSSNLNMEFAESDTFLSDHQEQVEVTGPEYPGLNLELPGVSQQVNIPKPGFRAPTRDRDYFEKGGMILSYWGFYTTSGELVSTKVAEK